MVKYLSEKFHSLSTKILVFMQLKLAIIERKEKKNMLNKELKDKLIRI